MMLMKRTSAVFAAAAVVISLCAVPLSAAPAKQSGVPDFTQGGKTDGSHDWTLGPTGARGWIYSWKHTSDARQILITEVAEGSPADGVLAVDDVILGVGKKPFSGDARIQFARAVMEAERETSRGVLQLVRWRAGKTENVEIKIPVMGTYSATAPYDCPKTANVFERGCEAIAKRGLKSTSIPNSINALALLAARRPEYQAMLSEYAAMVADYRSDNTSTWHCGYAMIYLAEYVIATGEHSLMPGLERLALAAARGQSVVGTWGHRFALADGRVGGYGCMNQPGISLAVGLVLAREAGVKHADLDRAITRAAGFLRWYVNKGAIPYGDHHPWPGHEDNGKCSSAAVLFDLLGDHEAATFYAKMSAAAYHERERGHTGNFFNILWAMPGVSRCGPLGTSAYWREQAWYYDLARAWDGSFRYPGSPNGEEEHGKYKNWDNTGTYLLAYALPLKSLYITGRKTSSVPQLRESEVEEVIAAGRDYFPTRKRPSGSDMKRYRYEHRSDEQLFAGLSSWSPAVRKRSAAELGRRDGDFTEAILKLLASPDLNARYGAAEALGQVGSEADVAARVSALTKTLRADDLWLRILAGEALASIGEPAKSAVPYMLECFIQPDREDDPRGMEQRYLCFSLFDRRGLIGRSLEGVDRERLVEAVRIGLQNEDGRARGSLGTVYENLSYDEIKPLLPAIHQAIVEPAPSGIMFANGIRLSGVALLAKYKVREGIPLCLQILEMDKWGKKNRIMQCLNTLDSYGVAAKTVLPQLRQVEEDLRAHREARMLAPAIEKARAMIEKLESATGTVELRSIDDR